MKKPGTPVGDRAFSCAASARADASGRWLLHTAEGATDAELEVSLQRITDARVVTQFLSGFRRCLVRNVHDGGTHRGPGQLCCVVQVCRDPVVGADTIHARSESLIGAGYESGRYQAGLVDDITVSINVAIIIHATDEVDHATNIVDVLTVICAEVGPPRVIVKSGVCRSGSVPD